MQDAIELVPGVILLAMGMFLIYSVMARQQWL